MSAGNLPSGVRFVCLTDFLLFFYGVGFPFLCDTLLQNARSDYHLTA